MDVSTSERHLTDSELFALAAPAAGEPEALPQHLSQCQSCSRALQEWKSAVRMLAVEDVAEIEARSPEDWRAAEASTMAAIRRAAGSGRNARPWRWAAGIAASLLIVALAMPTRKSDPGGQAPAHLATDAEAEAALSPSDREDDALLRDAAFLARGGDMNTDLTGEENL